MNDEIARAREATIALQKGIWENLDNAMANEYDVREWSVADIIADLKAFANDEYLDMPNETLEPHVKSWLEARRKLQ